MWGWRARWDLKPCEGGRGCLEGTERIGEEGQVGEDWGRGAGGKRIRTGVGMGTGDQDEAKKTFTSAILYTPLLLSMVQ